MDGKQIQVYAVLPDASRTAVFRRIPLSPFGARFVELNRKRLYGRRATILGPQSVEDRLLDSLYPEGGR